MEYMLYHQKSFAQVNFGFALAQFVPDFSAVDEVVGLFPKLDFGQFAIIPAVGDDAVLRGVLPVR